MPELVGADGFAQRLWHRAPLERVDIADACIRSGPFTLKPSLARKRLKEWQHFLFISPEVLVTTAIVDAKVLQLGWIQVVDKASGERHERHHQRPFGDIALSRALWNERCHFHSGRISIDVHNHLDAGEHAVQLSAQERAGLPAMSGFVRCLHALDDIEPMVVAMKVGDRRFAYSHKVALPAEGQIRCGGRTYRFSPDDSLAILDIHKAHYPRHTFWKWATTGGRSGDHVVALNLTKNVAEDDSIDHENGVWIDGKLHPVGHAVIERLGDSSDSDWSVRSGDGAVELVFTPEGRRSENTNVPGVVRSRFDQFYGRFSGEVRVDGAAFELTETWGLCEDHDSIW